MKALLTSLGLVLGLQAQEVMSWVPPYRLEQSRKALEHTVAGITADQWLTRIGLQFWLPTAKGEVVFATHEEKVGDAEVVWFRDWAKARKVKVLLTIYNHNGKWDWALAKAAFKDHQDAFVKNLVATLEKYQLDGIDLDLEGNGSLEADRADFARFVAKLSKVLKAKGKLLTVDSFHSPCFNAPHMGWWSDWKGQVDAIHSMGYGDLYEGSTATFTPDQGEPCMNGENIFRFSWQVAWARRQGIPAADLLLGLPGGRYEWGRSELPKHLEDATKVGAGICIWDIPSVAGGRRDTRWGSEAAWKALVRFRKGGR